MTSDPKFEQLRMFMTAQEIKDYVNDSMDLDHPQWDFLYNDIPDIKFSRTMSELWESKLEASKRPYHPHVLGSGVYDALQAGKDIFESSVFIEIEDDKRRMINHHHRTAALAALESRVPMSQHKLIPVEYIEPWENERYEQEMAW